MKKLFIALVCALLLIITGCNNKTDKGKETYEVQDMIGRTVNVPYEIDRVVCIGAGSLRLYSYIGDMSKLVGVEDIELTRTSKVSIRPYQLVNEDLFKTLPTCGVGGPTGSAEEEKILECNPDIIFSLYTSDASAMDELQRKTNIPVVTFSYGNAAPFNDVIPNAISLMGKILNKEQRANELNNYIAEVKKDINDRTKDIEDRPSVYLGCNSSWGMHGITSTSSNYAPFKVGNIVNAAEEYLKVHTDKTGDSIDLEALVDMDPEIIILDAGGVNILKSEYQTNKTVIDSLQAVKNGKVYLQMPFNAYYTNIELGLCNAYFAAYVVYPEAFNGVGLEPKVSEILYTFLGSSPYEKIKTEMFGGYQQIQNLESFLA